MKHVCFVAGETPGGAHHGADEAGFRKPHGFTLAFVPCFRSHYPSLFMPGWRPLLSAHQSETGKKISSFSEPWSVVQRWISTSNLTRTQQLV